MMVVCNQAIALTKIEASYLFKNFCAYILCLCILIGFTATAEAVTCKSYRICKQAVVNWCSGRHPGADRDRDGIPCENVCRSKAQVDKIRKQIGC